LPLTFFDENIGDDLLATPAFSSPNEASHKQFFVQELIKNGPIWPHFALFFTLLPVAICSCSAPSASPFRHRSRSI
jgi:hypothetical protein